MRKYVILEDSEVAGIDFSQVIEPTVNDLRYSLDTSKAITKYEGSQPSFLSGKAEHTWLEIMTVLEGEEWTSDIS